MNEPEQIKKGFKRDAEVKTFPVAFTLGEIKENISINTDTPINLEKEQILKQAFQFHSKGNIQEATKLYQYFIEKGFKDHRVFSNYGGILNDLDKLEEAEVLIKKAIEVNPNFADAYCNKGNILLKLGKLNDAELATRKAIEINPNFADAHYNLGTVLNNLDHLKEAELSLRKAIEINPNFEIAHNNLGNTLRALGKWEEAESSLRNAIKINPFCALYHFNLGNILQDLRRLNEAEISTRRAIKLQPLFVSAYCSLGEILKDSGELNGALDAYLKGIEINPNHFNIYQTITRFLSDSDPSNLDTSKALKIFQILLKRNDISHNQLFNLFNNLFKHKLSYKETILDSTVSIIDLLGNDTIILRALEKIIFKDEKLEKILTLLRQKICFKIAKNKDAISEKELEFIVALAKQCFLNEYIYSYTKEEDRSIKKIIISLKDNQRNKPKIAILACYSPLYKLLKKIPYIRNINPSEQSFQELIKMQVTEPLEEINLSNNIKTIGSINDDISKKVKSQYEENPYPRWRYANRSQELKFSINQAINSEVKPNSINPLVKSNQLKILIAGCGTGNQIIQAERFKNAQITAIDISKSSLSYAQRKINELKINNIEIIQMDILEVSLLEHEYDIIMCSGVLHHMNNPINGLKALLKVLKKEGYIKLGLYSEIARQDIIKARKYIANNNILRNKEGIKVFREDVISNNVKQIQNIKNWNDFYTTSECRDLCFHTQEHRFTITQLKEALHSNKLQFLGFYLPQKIKALYQKYYPEDVTQTNLQNWRIFEEKHPNTFRSMYQFWICKTNR